MGSVVHRVVAAAEDVSEVRPSQYIEQSVSRPCPRFVESASLNNRLHRIAVHTDLSVDSTLHRFNEIEHRTIGEENRDSIAAGWARRGPYPTCSCEWSHYRSEVVGRYAQDSGDIRAAHRLSVGTVDDIECLESQVGPLGEVEMHARVR